jgi:hypothetical protein
MKTLLLCRLHSWIPAAAVACTLVFQTTGHATTAAYVHVLKRDTSDTRFHLSELEAFANGVAPNNAGGATFGGLATSTNDVTAAGTFGDGNVYPTLGTTTALEHGGANKNPNNVLETAGNVWSTANGIGSNAQYTLDLGGSRDVTKVRLWPRADACCSNRWQNLEIQLLDANRNPVPGTLNLHTVDTGNVPLEFNFPTASTINSFSVSPQTIASGVPVTLSWNFAPAATVASINNGVGNVLPLSTNGVGSVLLDPGPLVTTNYQLSVTSGGQSSTANVTVTIDNLPIIQSFGANLTSVSAGTDVTLSWNVTNFDTIRINNVETPPGEASLVVTPLATTTYTLSATNASGTATAAITIIVADVTDLLGATGRFVEVVKNDRVNTYLHLAEIEVFPFGLDPDDAHADGTSGNDIGQNGSPSTETPPTTTTLAHGLPSSVFDGDIESGAEVWTTAPGLGVEPRYMLDLGSTNTINTVRLFGRGDACCPERLQNFTVNFYADNGSGSPGALVNSASFPGTAPAGLSGHVELSLAIPDPGIHSFVADKSFIPQGEPITLSWVVNAAFTSVSIDNGVGNVTGMTSGAGVGSVVVNPGPSATTTYTLTAVRPTGTSVSAVEVEVTDQPLIYAFGGAAGIVAPGTPVALTWDVGNVTGLDLNGTNVTGMTGASVTPSVSTTYVLTATNANGSVTRELRIRVVLPGEPVISEFLADNQNGLLDENGEPSDWIELCNPTGTIASLDGYYLTDDATNLTKWRIPAVTIAPNGYLVIFASGSDRSVPGSELHTNFSLSATGEFLALVKQDGTTIVTEFFPKYPKQRADVSFGFDSGALIEGYFLTPTPGAANGSGFSDFVADTTFSLDRGFYDLPISVEITTATPGAEIRYTLNGAKPTATNGLVYTAPIPIAQTTVLRAAAFKAGSVPTNVDTHTYIFPANVIANPNMRTSITQSPVYGPQMIDSLKSVPTISLVFQGDVERVEKESSVELINFEGGDAQLDAGMERFGSYVTDFAKRGIRINFRSLYGPGKLDFPIFAGHDYPIPPAAKVDSIDLRAGNHDMNARGAYMSNRFTDDTMLDMGQIAPHGRFVHVYLNGLYWGQYHLRERWNGAMLAEYFGGAKKDYEAINANNTGDEFLPGVVFDGSGQYWSETQSLVAGPTPFAAARSHIDMANVFDFMLLWVSGNSESEFRSAGSVPLGVPFKFFMKDADGFLRPPGHAANHNGPLNVMTRLRNEGDPDYKILLADRIHKHFFNDGAFTPAKNIARLQNRVDEVQTSFLSEAARWDFRTPTSWQAFQTDLINNQFPGLTNTMISRFRAAGMYPSTVAPSFNQHGGTVAPGFQLAMTAPAGTIFYTLDGSDPRLSAEPVEQDPPLTILTEAAGKRVLVPQSANDGFTDGAGKAWTQVGYNDAAWTAGTGGVGYDTAPDYAPYFGIDVRESMQSLRTSCLIRVPFTPSAGELAGKNGAELRVRYDDGFVAYLNGTEVARRNFSGAPNGNSLASASNPDTSAVVLESIDISQHIGLLNGGEENILAIHGLNQSTGSSDFLISADLRVSETTGGGAGGAVSPTAIAYTGTVPISARTKVRARVLSGGNWSALNEATFVQDFSGLVVSEIMYNPSPATAAEISAGFGNSENFEFLELLNTGAGTLDLTGVRFVDGIQFDFSSAAIPSISAGGRVLIVSNAAAFEYRYGAGLPIGGQYTGKLKDEGENVSYVDALGQLIRGFAYDNIAPWPTAAAGQGASLLLVNPESRPDHALPVNWTAGIFGGTPGSAEAIPQTFAQWSAANGGVGPNDDDDFDGLDGLLEFFTGGDPNVPSPDRLPVASIIDGRLALTFRQELSAAGISAQVEISPDLATWTSGVAVELIGIVNHGDGTLSKTYRSVETINSVDPAFIRLRATSEN